MQSNSGTPLTPRLHQSSTPLQYGSLPVGLAPSDAVVQSIRLRRAGSEWLCDNAKSFLRKVESRKSRRRKVQIQEDGDLIITKPTPSDTEDEFIKQCVLSMDPNNDHFTTLEYPESPLTETPPDQYCFHTKTTPVVAPFNNNNHHHHHQTPDCLNDLSDTWQHKFKIKPRTRPLASLSSGQLHMLRKLANIKLKTILEEYCPTNRTGWNWELPKLKKRFKPSDYKDKNAFRVPLSILQQRNGRALPAGIIYAINWLRDNAMEQIGLFRKSGVKSRIQKLKSMVESMNELDFQDQQAYDVADMVKQYFRELPEVLLTNKLSETLILIFQFVPLECRADAVQWVLLLLPDENSESLQVLLDLLHDVSLYSHINQMTNSNLALCLVPTLFHFRSTSSNTPGKPSAQELADNRAAHECLLYFIVQNTELFTITVDLVVQCHFNYLEDAIPVTLSNLGSNLNQDWRKYQELCMEALLKVAREKSLGWVSIYNPYRQNIDISYQKVGDEHPLELWRVCAEVEAPPSEVLRRILYERQLWDETCVLANVVKRLDSESDVYQYVLSYDGIRPLFNRDFCVLRSWKMQSHKCLIVETSVEHSDAPVTDGAVRGLILASRYLIEPCGSGKSRILYLARMDIRGKSLEWYKYFGHLCGIHINRICKSFIRDCTMGPESKV